MTNLLHFHFHIPFLKVKSHTAYFPWHWFKQVSTVGVKMHNKNELFAK